MSDDAMRDGADLTPVDLSALDPTRDAARFNDVATAVARDAGRAILRRDEGVFDRLARWWPPTLIAAGLILAVAVPGLTRRLTTSARVSGHASAMDVLGIPRELTDVLRSTETPSLSDLHAALAANSGQ